MHGVQLHELGSRLGCIREHLVELGVLRRLCSPAVDTTCLVSVGIVLTYPGRRRILVDVGSIGA